MEIAYWNKEIETIDRDSLKHLQLKYLKETIGYALRTSLYKKRLQKAGITSPDDIKSLDDLKRIPFTTKDDLRESYPRGLLAVDIGDVVRIHTSSGTTGTPTVIYHTQQDLNNWTELLARCIIATGATRNDVFQNMMSYGLFTGGLVFHYGAEKAGVLVIPAGAGNTEKQIELMRDFKTTIVHITPSYALYLADILEEKGIDPEEELNLQVVYLGAEPYSQKTREKIEKIYGVNAFNCYGLSEMNGPGVGFECPLKDGLHIWEDNFILEVVDPLTGEPLPDGREGELVLTTINREAMPIIRYRTGDITFIYPQVCGCGRTHRKISPIKGRTDDMFIIKGVNVFPSDKVLRYFIPFKFFL